MSISKRERRRILNDLNEIVGPNLERDNISMLIKLSEDFYKEVQLSKECIARKDAAGAEVHRIIAEYINEVSLTFEAIKE